MLLRIVCHLNSLAKSLIVNMDEADIKDREDSGAGGVGVRLVNGGRIPGTASSFGARPAICDSRFLERELDA